MTVTFVSNFINHHQAPLADCLYEKLGMEYHFVQTMPMEEERVNMGWDTGMTKKPYVRLYYEEPEACLQLILDSDVVIFGWTGETRLLTKRMETGKPTLRVSERIYREGQWKAISPKGLLAKYREHIRYKNTNLCMLCAGAYVASDFHLIHAYPDKMFKWGYFPPFKAYAPGELEAKKEAFMQENLVYATKPGETGPLQIVWAGRMIPLKHPEYVIKAAGKLTEQGFRYHVHMIGAGQMEEELRRMVVEQGLSANFTFYGFGTPEQVRELMEKCHIHLFTSNYLEGWGAVVNEGMNSGCVEIASAQAGAVPYLIAHGKNGFVYHKDSYKEFEKQVLYVVENWEQVQHVGQKAYETIANLWNAEKAADRLLTFCDHLQNGKIVFAKEGPLSVAPVISPRTER